MRTSGRWVSIAAATLVLLVPSALANAKADCDSGINAALIIKILDKAIEKVERSEFLDEHDWKGITAVHEMAIDCYEEKRHETAFHLFSGLALIGSPDAAVASGLMLIDGAGTPKNVQLGIDILREAAERGHSYAQMRIGAAYFIGKELPADLPEAAKWTLKAAEQGEALAQTMMGILYAGGYGVPQNDMQAYVWFSVAVANGQEDVIERRDAQAERLSGSQRAKAQELAAELWERIPKEARKEPSK